MLAEALCGTWGRPLDLEAPDAAILWLHPDGRAVEIFRQRSAADRVLAGTMRFVAEDGADVYRVRTKTGAKGYLITLRRAGAELIVINGGESFSYRRLAADEWPEGFERAASRAVWR